MSTNLTPLDRQLCKCADFAADFRYMGASVSFDCPQHGRVTIDRRLVPAPILQPLNPLSPPINPFSSVQPGLQWQSSTVEIEQRNFAGEQGAG